MATRSVFDETDAENLLPHERGRAVLPRPGGVGLVSFEEAGRMFEADAELSTRDPLAAWIRYIDVLRNQVFPGGHHEIDAARQACAKTFQVRAYLFFALQNLTPALCVHLPG